MGTYCTYCKPIARIHSSPIHCCHCCNVLVPRNQNGVACNFCTGAEGNTIEAVLGVASFCGSNSGQLLYLHSSCPGCQHTASAGVLEQGRQQRKERSTSVAETQYPVCEGEISPSTSHQVIQSIHQSIQAILKFPIWPLMTQVPFALMQMHVIRRPKSHSSGGSLCGKMNMLTLTHTFSCMKFPDLKQNA